VRPTSLPTVLLLAAIAASLTGCSRNPVAPAGTRVGAPGAGTLRAREIDNPTPEPLPGHGATASIRLGVGESGVVHAGRFTLFIHKNTLNVPAQFSMWVENPQAMQVDIEVMPPIANDFQVPAHLTADLNDQPTLDLDTQTMYYWGNGWELPEDVSVDGGARTITADMKALTRCMVGDADGKHHVSLN
jgi:hypothetical protein